MAYNLSRMTIFALLSSIENDLRENIKFAINGLDKDKIKIEQNIHKKINDRFEKENGFKNTEDNLIELVDYLDLGDTFQIINSNKEIFIDDFSAKIKGGFKSELQHLQLLRSADVCKSFAIQPTPTRRSPHHRQLATAAL